MAFAGQVSDKTLETTMRQRYFLIEPQYSDPDTFCHFTVGSDRVRASIQIYANIRKRSIDDVIDADD